MPRKGDESQVTMTLLDGTEIGSIQPLVTQYVCNKAHTLMPPVDNGIFRVNCARHLNAPHRSTKPKGDVNPHGYLLSRGMTWLTQTIHARRVFLIIMNYNSRQDIIKAP